MQRDASVNEALETVISQQQSIRQACSRGTACVLLSSRLKSGWKIDHVWTAPPQKICQIPKSHACHTEIKPDLKLHSDKPQKSDIILGKNKQPFISKIGVPRKDGKSRLMG